MKSNERATSIVDFAACVKELRERVDPHTFML